MAHPESGYKRKGAYNTFLYYMLSIPRRVSPHHGLGSGMEIDSQSPSAAGGGNYEELIESMECDLNLPLIAYQGTLRDRFLAALVEIANGSPEKTVFLGLSSYDEKELGNQIATPVETIPTIFWAVASGSVNLVKFWVMHGADTSATHTPSGMPLLAFAINRPAATAGGTAQMIAHLLSYGASPHSIPSEFYLPYC